MSTTARITKQPVIIEYQGKIYKGEQIVEGTKYRYQRVEFQGKTKVDSFRYLADPIEYMNGVAQQLLFEMLQDKANES